MVKKHHKYLLITIYLSCLIFFWQADLNTNVEDESRSFYGVSSQYESPENMVITCSTKVCSFGKQVVEKVEVGSRQLGAGLSLAAVLSLQVFVACIYLNAKYMSQLLSERWMPWIIISETRRYKTAPAVALSQDTIEGLVVSATFSLNLSFWRHVNF